MPSSHLILCRPLLLLPSIPPSIRVFSNESTLRMRWPKNWGFSFSVIKKKKKKSPGKSDFSPCLIYEGYVSMLSPIYLKTKKNFRSDQSGSVAQSCSILCDPMNPSTPGLPVHHQLLEFTQTHVHRVSDAIQPSHPLSSPSPLAPNPSQHQSIFQRVNSSHEVAKVLEYQL